MMPLIHWLVDASAETSCRMIGAVCHVDSLAKSGVAADEIGRAPRWIPARRGDPASGATGKGGMNEAVRQSGIPHTRPNVRLSVRPLYLTPRVRFMGKFRWRG
jgi:hypothetical protein